VYIQQLVYVMCLCCLAVGRIGIELLPTASQHKRKHMTHTNRCIYTAIPPDGEQ
jgi:hypothetical protein